MGRSIDDAANIHGKGLVKSLPFPAVEKPQATSAVEKPSETKANGNKFCSYADGGEAAVVRGLALKR